MRASEPPESPTEAIRRHLAAPQAGPMRRGGALFHYQPPADAQHDYRDASRPIGTLRITYRARSRETALLWGASAVIVAIVGVWRWRLDRFISPAIGIVAVALVLILLLVRAAIHFSGQRLTLSDGVLRYRDLGPWPNASFAERIIASLADSKRREVSVNANEIEQIRVTEERAEPFFAPAPRLVARLRDGRGDVLLGRPPSYDLALCFASAIEHCLERTLADNERPPPTKPRRVSIATLELCATALLAFALGVTPYVNGREVADFALSADPVAVPLVADRPMTLRFAPSVELIAGDFSEGLSTARYHIAVNRGAITIATLEIDPTDNAAAVFSSDDPSVTWGSAVGQSHLHLAPGEYSLMTSTSDGHPEGLALYQLRIDELP